MENRFVFCPDCGIKNFSTDKKCGICGKSLLNGSSQQISSISKSRQIRGFVVLVFLCFIVYYRCFDNNTKAKNGSGTDLKSEACVHSREFVRRELISPQSADFSMCYDKMVNELGANEFGVRGYVDAVNSFNAPIRQQFVCRLEYISGDPIDIKNWNLVEVRFE